MTLTIRSLFAALAAALALACAGVAGNGGADAHREHPTGWSAPRQSAQPAAKATPALARMLVRGGVLVLDPPGRRSGAPPRMAAAGTDPSHDHSFSVQAVIRRISGARTRGILNLALARQLAAARDGTLSARSTGVPPPAQA